MEGVPAFLACERIAPVVVREGLAKHHTQLAQLLIESGGPKLIKYILIFYILLLQGTTTPS